MKFLRNVVIFSICIALQCFTSNSVASVTKKVPTPKKIAPHKTTTLLAQSNALPSSIPYMKELQASSFSAAQKQSLIIAWQNLHQAYLTSSNATAPVVLTQPQATAVAPLFTTNFLAQMHAYFANTQNFATLPNDPQNLNKQFATFHMAKTCARLASVHTMSFEDNTPTVAFSGDMRDQGVIVNIKNNTDTTFSISQNSLDGKTSTPIGVVNPGLNGVNLHTAALQASNTKQSTTPTNSVYSFNFQELDAENPTTIAIKMYTGTQLIEFLETLPRKDKGVFNMNGLPTSKDFLTNPDDWYMVLIQNPTSKNQPQPNFDQRIQAINISKLTGPYLLSMQINAETVEISAEQTGQTPTSLDLFQPSLTDVLIPKNKDVPMQNFPVIILSKFLQDMPQLQTLWMLHTTSYIATLSNYKFFGPSSFGSTFEYFEKMGFFDRNNKFTFFIDRYNTLLPLGYALYNSPWLITAAVYETELSNCSDMPQVYTGQDAYGHVIANAPKFYYVSFQVIIEPQVQQTINQSLFNRNSFNNSYALVQYQHYSFITNALHADIDQDLFATLTQLQPHKYQLTWSNKKNKVLSSQYIYLESPISNIKIAFVNTENNWVGTSIPTNLIPTPSKTSSHFKATYEFSSTNNKHILLAQATSPIDKVETILPLQFSQYPIKQFYLDIYNTFNVMPYTRCFVIKDGILPEPLMSLTQQDWQSGIYMITTVKNNDQITPANPGAVTLVFYKSDKTILGEVTLEGQFNNTLEKGIKEPVHAYNPHFSPYNCLTGMYLSTGVLLQHRQPN